MEAGKNASFECVAGQHHYHDYHECGAMQLSMLWMCAGDQTKMITTPIYILIRWPAEPVCGVEVRGEASWGGGDTDNCSSDQVHHE